MIWQRGRLNFLPRYVTVYCSAFVYSLNQPCLLAGTDLSSEGGDHSNERPSSCCQASIIVRRHMLIVQLLFV